MTQVAISTAEGDQGEPLRSQPAADLPGRVMTVRTVGAAELCAGVDRWQRLVETALVPNVFYEPCALLPAIEHLAGDAELEFVVVEAPSRKHADGPPLWCGLFPLRRSRLPGLGVAYRSLWKHIHCFLCTPLVRREVGEEVLDAFFDWLDRDAPGSALLKFDAIEGEGPFHQLLVETLRRREMPSWLSGRFCRALFRRAASYDEYLLDAMPRKRRHEVRRLAKRFAEQGAVQYQTLHRADELDTWLDDFLQLELDGWKGHRGTALACSQQGRDFFRDLARDTLDQQKLMMTSLVLDGRTVAQKCNLLTGRGGFAFKIAYAEAFSQFSPGVLLEMHAIESLHRRDDVDWMDSCADPDHPMINQLWKDRRTIEGLWVAGTAALARAAVALMPLARGVRDGLSLKRTKTSNHQLSRKAEP